MNETASLGVYDTMPAHRAVLKNTLPAIAAMLMQLVYNLADMFFIGLTRDDLQVAAVSIAFHVFMIFMAFSTVFGIGGASVISRALGGGRSDYAKKVSAFCMWASVAVGIAASGAFYIFMDDMLRIIGVNSDIHKYTRDYIANALQDIIFPAPRVLPRVFFAFPSSAAG